jgi:hypothetical protein
VENYINTFKFLMNILDHKGKITADLGTISTGNTARNTSILNNNPKPSSSATPQNRALQTAMVGIVQGKPSTGPTQQQRSKFKLK